MGIQERFDQEVRAAKRRLFEKISQDCEVFVSMNLEHEGVRIPEQLRKGDRLVLKFSPRYDYRLEILEEGVEQILRFGAEDFPVFVAWDAIFCLNEEVRGQASPAGGAWPYHAPKALRFSEDVQIALDDLGEQIAILHPDGTIEAAEYIH